MIGTAKEFPRVAARVCRDACSLVRTTVVQDLHVIVGMSHHQNRLCPDCGAKVIPRFCHLVLMADIDPGVCEQVLHFELEDLIVDVDVAMNLCLVNQISDSLDVSTISGHRNLLSSSKRSSTGGGILIARRIRKSFWVLEPFSLTTLWDGSGILPGSPSAAECSRRRGLRRGPRAAAVSQPFPPS